MSLNPFAKEFVPKKKKASYAVMAAMDSKIEEEDVKANRNLVDTSNWYVLSKHDRALSESKPSTTDINCNLFVTKVDISSKMSDSASGATALIDALGSAGPITAGVPKCEGKHNSA